MFDMEKFVERANFWVQFGVGLVSFGLALLITVIGFSQEFYILSFIGFILFVLIFFALVWIRSLRKQFKVFVPEREIGLVFKKNGDFNRILDKGGHFIDTRGLKLEKTIGMKGHRVEEESIYRTHEGLRVIIFWIMKYGFIKENIINIGDEDKKRNVAYSIVKPPFKNVARYTRGALRAIVEQKEVQHLFQCEKNVNLMTQLEKEIEERVKVALTVKEGEIQIIDTDALKLTITAMIFPKAIEDEIEQFHAKSLYNSLKLKKHRPFTFPSEN